MWATRLAATGEIGEKGKVGCAESYEAHQEYFTGFGEPRRTRHTLQLIFRNGI
jgi:hypothetical protein